MKRIVMIALVAGAISVAAPGFAIDFNITGGADFGGEIEDFDTDAKTGYSLGLEMTFDLPIVELGVGVEYGFPRGTEIGDVDIDYKMIYGIGRLGIVGPLYLAARVGYADVGASDIYSGEVDGGESWSAGLGVDIGDKLMFEAFLNNFAGEVAGTNSSFDYTTYSARVVYTF